MSSELCHLINIQRVVVFICTIQVSFSAIFFVCLVGQVRYLGFTARDVHLYYISVLNQ